MPRVTRNIYVVMGGQRIGLEWVKSLMFTVAWTDRETAETNRQLCIENGFSPLEVTVETLQLRS
jgi:hypothetical protein